MERERPVVSAVAVEGDVPASPGQDPPDAPRAPRAERAGAPVAQMAREAPSPPALSPSEPSPSGTALSVEAASATQPAPAPSEPLVVEDLESLRSLWPAVVDLVRAGNALLGALIEEAQPVAVEGEELTVAFAATAPFLKKKAEDPANRAAVTAALRDITGGRWRLSYELSGELEAPEQLGPGRRTEQEWVARFMEEFDAEELPGEWAAPSGGSAQGGTSSEAAENGVEVVTSEEKGA